MPKAKSFQEIEAYVAKYNRSLITNEEQFNNMRLMCLPSQIKLEVSCKCRMSFFVTFNSFRSKGKHSCNDCNASDLKEKVYPIDRIESVIKMYTDGIKMKEISKALKMKSQTISDILKENNIKIRNNTEYRTSVELSTNRQYEFDQSFFEVINTPNKAYWLGFIYADGNVYVKNYDKDNGKSKGGSLEIGLQRQDEYHLTNFINDVGGNNLIEQRDVRLGEKTYPSSRIVLNSIKMCRDLINHGCTPRKSLSLKFPNSVPDQLMSHFIRGYIDGDGCVAFYTYEKIDSFSVTILGTQEFLEGIKYVLNSNEINTNKIKKDKSEAFLMGITGQDNLARLYNFLYSDANVFLGRKIDKYRQALIYFNKRFNISDTAKLFYIFDDELSNKIENRKSRHA